MTIGPALNVPCPTCRAGAGQPCRSRRAISLHQGRRQALADLGGQADQMLRADLRGPGQREPERRHTSNPAGPVPVLIGRTGEENVIPEDAECWPPWEEPPVPGCLAESGITVSGLVWCPVHEEYEELRDGIPAVRLMRG